MIVTSSPVSIIPSTQAQPRGIRDLLSQIAAAPNDPNTRFKAVSDMGSALSNALNQIYNYLRSPLPFPDDLGFTDPSGTLVAVLGTRPDGTAQNTGLTIFDYFQDVVAWVGLQVELPLAITATTNASPDVITIVGHGYSNGDTILILNSTGDTAINGVRIVENKTANTFTTTDLAGTPINGNGAYAGGGTATRFFGGGWFETFGIGGTDMAHAKIRAYADGNVVIDGATITLDTNGVTTTIGNLSAGAAGVTGLQVKNDTPPSLNVQVTDKGYYIRGTDQATYITQLSAPSNNGFLLLTNLAATKKIQLNAATAAVNVADTGAGTSINIIPSQIALAGASGAISALTQTDLALADASNNLQIDVDASVPHVVVGQSGGSQSVVSASSVSATNAGGTRTAVLSAGGSVSGTALGGVTWSLGSALTIGGFTSVSATGVVTSSNGFTGSQTYVKTVNFGASTVTTGTITVANGIVTNMT